VPVGAAAEAGDDDGAAIRRGDHRGRRVERTDAVIRDRFDRLGAQLGSEVDQVVVRDALHVERRRLGRERLRAHRLLARHVRLRHRALLHRPDRLAGAAIEDVGERLLRQLHDGRDPLSVDGDVDQDWMRRHVVVPDVVMNELLVPHLLAGLRLDGHECVAIEVVARPMAAVDVVGWRLDRQVDVTELGIR
jgi:hypothetical protein